MKVNLGCGHDYRKSFMNIDISKECKADVYYNVEDGLSLKDNSVSYIYSRHVLEHIHKDKFNFVLSEIIRVCKNNAVVELYLPHFSCGITYRTIDHHTFISYFTFNHKNLQILNRKFYYLRTSFKYNNNNYNFFKIFNPILSFLPNVCPLVYERLFCWIYPVEEVYFKIKIVK